jgi:uncharacterized protein YjaZ
MSRKIEVNAAVVEEMGRRRHGKRRWTTWPPETQQVMRERIIENLLEVKRAEQAVEERALRGAR